MTTNGDVAVLSDVCDECSTIIDKVESLTIVDKDAREDVREPTIAVFIMCKNEQERIHVTIDSVQDHVDAVILMDTGSEDDTIEIATAHCTKIPIHVGRTVFEDFGKSWTETFRFAQTFDYDYLIQLDANDEFRGRRPTREELTVVKDSARVKRVLQSSTIDIASFWVGKIFNRLGATGRYIGRVHEYYSGDVCAYVDSFLIYQDRRIGCGSSVIRFQRDRVILEEDLAADPTSTRTVFYLAQTYMLIGENQLAYDTYAKRVDMEGFLEERFYSMLMCGELAARIDIPWSVQYEWYTKAFMYDARVEPLLKITKHYLAEKNYLLAYAFVKLALQLKDPLHRTLFVGNDDYSYNRYHLMSIVAYYAWKMTGKDDIFIEGREALIEAIQTGLNIDTDKANLKWYKIPMLG